jgi:hypothetical protein
MKRARTILFVIDVLFHAASFAYVGEAVEAQEF